MCNNRLNDFPATRSVSGPAIRNPFYSSGMCSQPSGEQLTSTYLVKISCCLRMQHVGPGHVNRAVTKTVKNNPPIQLAEPGFLRTSAIFQIPIESPAALRTGLLLRARLPSIQCSIPL